MANRYSTRTCQRLGCVSTECEYRWHYDTRNNFLFDVLILVQYVGCIGYRSIDTNAIWTRQSCLGFGTCWTVIMPLIDLISTFRISPLSIHTSCSNFHIIKSSLKKNLILQIKLIFHTSCLISRLSSPHSALQQWRRMSFAEVTPSSAIYAL